LGYGQRLRMQRSADVRVLKAQLDLIADVVHAARYAMPAWAFAISYFGSSAFGYLGRQPFEIALVAAAAVAAVSFVALRVVTVYQYEAAGRVSPEQLQAWFPRFIAMQFAVSTTWSLLPWLLWQPDDPVNHLFIAGCVGGTLGALAVSRSTHMDMLIASLVPLAVASTVRFLFGGEAIDLVIAAFLPLLVVQLFADGRRLTYRLDQDSRLRFEVEDLARELEEARDEALRKRFEAETANASKTAFLANMSHELRTPLNAILGFSEIIAKEVFGDVGSPRYVEYASDIHASGAHLLSLINDLLDVAKIEAGRMEIEPCELDVRKCFDSALKIIQVKARERRQELVIDVDPEVPPLIADERALKQILINLVSNAVKFTPEGGRIIVLASRARDGSFQIMVEDNGPGIPREKLDKIFKPFSQVDNRYDRQGGGTGLGLALVRGLAELHGGRAWLESEQGEGCRAFVILPSMAGAKSASPTVAA
jgi:two-component system, cell cycle sensor histidine kinase PleC